jgi:hypothetical protein
MDENQKQNITQASEQLTDSAQQSFQMLADRTVALQESNLRLTQNFFQNWIEQVNNRAEFTREATQNLQEQGQRQREAFETLSQEATNAYSEFLNSALSFYQEALSTASQVAQQNMQQGAQATQQAMEAVSQAGQQGAQAVSEAGQQGAEAANQSAQRGARGAEQAGQEAAGEEVRATAAARRRAEEMNVDLAEVEGTGQDGQITVEDVRRSAQEG